ncbi:MAG: hypothetical protein QF552_09595 [Litorilituus sp.]|jgi:hypothetical protein|nr:hypothetical protein [Litorilituus sp.]
MFKSHKFLLLFYFVSCSFLAFSEGKSTSVEVMSLNIYGWKTMPQFSSDYAKLINEHKVDILAIQEGVEDWQLSTRMPTNYNRAKTLQNSLGKCWQRSFQLFVNRCQGNTFIDSGRFDLTDGINVTRTGEYAVIANATRQFLVINVHFDHQSKEIRLLNAAETLNQIENYHHYPQIVLGDFNHQCTGMSALLTSVKKPLELVVDAGIDCLFINGFTSKGKVIDAYPSDHPAVLGRLTFN